MPDKNSHSQPETLKRRCPRLGSEISFAYCVTGGDAQTPCWKIFDCWWERFDVTAYLQARLTEEAFRELCARAAAPPKNKLTSILEIAQQVKNTKE